MLFSVNFLGVIQVDINIHYECKVPIGVRGNVVFFLFQPHDVNVLGFTDYVNYTDNIVDIVNSVTNDTNIIQCCNYHLQLLDKYCVSRTTVC